MGNFIEVTKDGIKSYTLFSKSTIKQIVALPSVMQTYSFNLEDKSAEKVVFLDSNNNLLSSAGILLSKSTERNKAFFKVERERYKKTSRSSLPQRAEKVFIHNVGVKDSVKDHMFFLTNGIKSMFTTQFYIDLDNVLKLVVPQIELSSKKSVFKVFSGKGFKAEMIYEEMAIKNFATKRSNVVYVLTVKQTSSKHDLTEFSDFTSKLEKYCKEAIPTDDTIYEIAKRMTK